MEKTEMMEKTGSVFSASDLPTYSANLQKCKNGDFVENVFIEKRNGKGEITERAEKYGVFCADKAENILFRLNAENALLCLKNGDLAEKMDFVKNLLKEYRRNKPENLPKTTGEKGYIFFADKKAVALSGVVKLFCENADFIALIAKSYADKKPVDIAMIDEILLAKKAEKAEKAKFNRTTKADLAQKIDAQNAKIEAMRAALIAKGLTAEQVDALIK